MIEAQRIAQLSDNYAWLLRCTESGALAIVDPAEPAPIVRAVREAGGTLGLILLTHHHGDHVAAASEVRSQFGARVVGAAADRGRLPPLDQAVSEGSQVQLGTAAIDVWETPGHTVGHVSFVVDQGSLLLCGDTLFSLGCGRLLEGTPTQMFASLRRFAALSPSTLVCCGHEYTASNARFACYVHPANEALRLYSADVMRQRKAGQATVPSRLSDELACNPFLRARDAAALGDLRARKDRF